MSLCTLKQGDFLDDVFQVFRKIRRSEVNSKVYLSECFLSYNSKNMNKKFVKNSHHQQTMSTRSNQKRMVENNAIL